MIKTAVTGNIASGKSAAEKIIKAQGFKLIDCDEINAELMKRIDVINEIKSAFAQAADEGGSISKNKLAEIVFSSKHEMRRLENIMHPKISAEIEKFFSRNKNETAVFVSAPVLFEAGMEKMFDKIIFISAPENLRLARLMKRNNLTREQAQLRINAQKSEEEKIKKSDFVIYNNSDLKTLEKNIIECIRLINC